MTYELSILKINRSTDEAEIKALCKRASIQFDGGSWRTSGATAGVEHEANKRLDAIESANKYVSAINASTSKDEIENIKSKAFTEPYFIPEDMILISIASFGRLRALGCEI